jgi:hypothetical protein
VHYVNSTTSDSRLPLCDVIIREQLPNVLSGSSDIAGIVNRLIDKRIARLLTPYRILVFRGI